ncbi:MAG: hypothetical protein ACP5O8_02295 [Candidatus Aenigmatarchaeota archaeon]
MKTKIAIVAILALLMLSSVCNATIISPPQSIQLEGGKEDNSGIWRGGYWTFTVAVDQMDSLVGKVVLPANTTEKGENGAEIKTRKSVEIEIKPVKSYYKRLLALAPVEDRIVAPKVCRGGLNKVLGTGWWDKNVNIEPTVVEYYEWAEPSWEKYTVFEVSVYVEGSLAGRAELNTEGGTKDLVVNTAKGSVLVKNLGRLEGDYSEPHTPNVVIFNEKYIFTTDAIQYIRYDHGRTYKYWGSDKSYLCYIENSRAFSTYWFGTVRWNPKSVSDSEVADSPAPFKPPQWYGYDIIDPVRGWKASDSFWDFIRDPVKPKIYPEEGDDSLIWYLNKMTSEGNIADKWLSGYEWQIEKKDNKPNAVIVKIPWGAYSGAPIVTFFVPSELADTFVYRPPIADVRIQKSSWLNGSDIEPSGKKKCQLELKQFAKTLSSATITAEISTSRASVSPTSITVTMAPNETKIVTFEVANLGVDSDIEGKVFFTVKRTWDGAVTSTSQLSFTLLAPVLPENMSDVVDRTGPKPDPDNTVNEFGSNTWVWIVAMLCGTAVAITLMLIIRDEYRRKKAKELAKGAPNLVKTVTQPVWQKYKPQLATIIFGSMLLFGGLLWQMYSPFRILPIEPKLPLIGTLFSTSLEAILSCLLGFIFLLMGIGSLLRALTAPVVQSGTVKLIATDLMQFLKKDKEEEK